MEFYHDPRKTETMVTPVFRGPEFIHSQSLDGKAKLPVDCLKKMCRHLRKEDIDEPATEAF